MTQLPLLKIAGITLIVVGVISLVIPLLPGLLFIFLGLGLVSPKFQSWIKAKWHALIARH